MSNWDTDTQYEEQRITEVTAGDAGWSLYFDSMGFFCPSDACQQAPAVGETARLYGKGFGFLVRGLVIEGRAYFYRTEEQQAEWHAAWGEAQKKERADKLDAERDERDVRRAALPEVFQRRLNVYERRNPNWRRDFESYELGVCEDAAAMAQHFVADLEALERFAKQSSDEQRATLPGLFPGHSGNSWACATNLAARFMRGQEYVEGAHGALCPLIGCTEYGCPGADMKAP